MKKPLSAIAPGHILFDRRAVALHRHRAAGLDWARHRFLFDEVAARLADRLLDISHSFDLALDLGGRGGAFADALLAMGKARDVIRTDLSDAMKSGQNGKFLAVDEEFLPFQERSLDLVGSVLALHWTNDLPGALAQIARALRPDGLFLGALFGIDSLHELRSCLMEAETEVTGGASPRISPFTEVRDAGALLQRAGLALPVTDVDMITLKYDHPFALMQELRGMGESNALVLRQKTFTRRQIMMRAADLYMERYADDEGRIPASFQIIYMTGWSPHSSQQKPLAPGSGQARLSDYLE
ncbi:MAG: SAM-dependent methyltransferase [Sneathiella sp.]|jgi:SAM-dependent methyltransferase|uniref:methyltransferase domain-containing protein n=1 Tax=Sneathiella sp. TaxID=1964365 RepID=UPI000C3768C4|nr:methyltransferase domain-containing protein [Sneathiella sp.]MAL78441.1 SAM-dependent methyltransferase [Sneathiella sp.]